MHGVGCILTYLFRRLRGAKKNGDEGKPHYTRRVHREPNGLGFVKVLGDTPSLDGVHSTRDHEEDAISQGANDLQVCDVTFEHSPGQLGVHGLMLVVVYDDVGRVHAKPDEDAQKLDGYQARSDGQLRRWADEPGSRHGLLTLLEYAVNPVGLGQEGRVTDAHPQAQEHPPEGAHRHVGLGDHQERDDVAEEDARQQDVAELPARRPDDGRVVVADERGHDEDGGDDAQHGQEDGDHGPGRVPLQLDDGDVLAAGPVLVGPLVVRAVLARVLVELELVAVAGLAGPAAGRALLRLLPLAGLAGQGAHGVGDLPDPFAPLHVLDLQREE